jgi:hypothetical protein
MNENLFLELEKMIFRMKIIDLKYEWPNIKKAEKYWKSRKDRKKAEDSLKSRIFLLKAEEVAALL